MLRNAVLVLALLAVASSAAGDHDEFELEDTVAIVSLDRELVAHTPARGSSKQRLQLGERLIWHGARGRIGFAVTDRRVFGFHSRSGWSSRRLRVAEASPARPELGSRIALFVTYWWLILGFISRRFESQADLFGASAVGDHELFIRALEKISDSGSC